MRNGALRQAQDGLKGGGFWLTNWLRAVELMSSAKLRFFGFVGVLALTEEAVSQRLLGIVMQPGLSEFGLIFCLSF
jgi:hypothetical protein